MDAPHHSSLTARPLSRAGYARTASDCPRARRTLGTSSGANNSAVAAATFVAMPAVENRTGGRPRHASRSHFHWNRWQVTLLVIALVVVIGAVVAVVVVHSNPSRKHAAVPPVAPNRCPLTDLPAPGGKVPRRPALLVKIGNEPEGARPQSGLNEADIVYDTPAEGFIMRYVAVYQCNNASSIGPTRSVRWVDWHILRQFIHPILAYANGINPDVDTVNGLKWIESADLLTGAQSAGTRISS